MSFGTAGISTVERVSVSKYLNHGINKAKINNIVVEKAKNTESRRIVIFLEGEAVADKGFEGIDGAKGRVGKMTTSYMKTDAQYQDFMRQIGVISDKLGVRPQVDAVTASTIEEYITKVLPYLTGKQLWWNIGGEEWDEKKFSLKILRYDFVKALSEIDESTLVHEGYITTEARNAAGTVILRFDKTNKYHFTPYVKADNGFNLPGAQATAQTFVAPTLSTAPSGPPSFIPASEPKPFSVDDLPFGGGNDTDLPFGN